ncbi:MAG: McrC family protein [Gemmataceae bacterium]
MSSRQIIALRERVTKEIRLPRSETAYLLVHHSRHLDVRPLGGKVVRVTPRGYVGTLMTPRCQFEIQPKMSVPNFLWLLGCQTNVESEPRQENLSRGRILEVLVSRLIDLLNEVVGSGLRPDYVQIDEAARYLQGRLDVAGQLREHPFRKDKLRCEVSHLTLDTPRNQIPKATAECLCRSGMLKPELKNRLVSLLQSYGEVSSVDLDEAMFAAVRRNLLSESERPLVDLCELFWQSYWREANAGMECPSCLINLEQVFERYCSREIVEAFQKTGDPRFRVALQETHSVVGQGNQAPPCVYRPDVVIHFENEPIGALDMKWKVPPYPQTDVYQAVSYGAMLPCRWTALVYPGRSNKLWNYGFAEGDPVLSIYRVRVVGNSDSVQQSLHRFLKHLTQRTARRLDVLRE